jgi:hypothetical protein
MSNLLADRQSWPELREPLQAMKYLDFAGYLPDDCLVKVDRASMAASLEVRCPLLDHRVVELAWSLPLDYRDNKRVLKTLLERYLPRSLFERPKRGFGVPIGAWLRGPLRDWAETLRRIVREGYLEPAAVRAIWQQHLSGRRDRPELLWHLSMFQAWHEYWQAPRIEPGPPRTRRASLVRLDVDGQGSTQRIGADSRHRSDGMPGVKGFHEDHRLIGCELVGVQNFHILEACQAIDVVEAVALSLGSVDVRATTE